MRRSTVITIAIMLTAFGAMFAAAGSALQPLAEDAETGKLLSSFLRMRGDVVPESRVRLARVGASDQRLAEAGRGLLIRLQPSERVCARRGGLRALALRTVHEATQRYTGIQPAWIEIVFEAGPPEGDAAEIRTLLEVRSDGTYGEPTPRVPATWAPSR